MGLRSVLSRRLHHPPRDPKAIRSGIIECAESLHSDGLDSRIPFLKAVMTDQPVPCGSTAWRHDGVPVPDWRENEFIVRPTLHEVLRFNSFNAHRGIQGLPARPFEEDDTTAVKIVRCKVSQRGDLCINVVDDPMVNVDHGAAYIPNLHTILMRGPYEKSKFALAHELEHACHSTLAFMVLGSTDAIPRRRMEYLAMLSETLDAGVFRLLDVAMRDWPGMLRHAGQAPYVLSSFDFLLRLPRHPGVSVSGLAKYRLELELTGNISQEHMELLGKIYVFARVEYERLYEDIFGIRRSELKGIISELPRI